MSWLQRQMPRTVSAVESTVMERELFKKRILAAAYPQSVCHSSIHFCALFFSLTDPKPHVNLRYSYKDLLGDRPSFYVRPPSLLRMKPETDSDRVEFSSPLSCAVDYFVRHATEAPESAQRRSGEGKEWWPGGPGAARRPA